MIWKTKIRGNTRRSETGMSLAELMVAMFVLIVGVLGGVILVVLSIGGNGRNRQASNATVIAQMVTEKIMSVPANTSPTVTITDCAGTSNNISTTGAAPAAGAGSQLLADGSAIDFSKTLGSAGAPTGYYMAFTDCGTSQRQATYDIRWNIQTISPYVKLVTVSAKLRGAGNDLKVFAPPVTIRSMVGQGS
jgi:type II secretory pathway pseudopilin PulG